MKRFFNAKYLPLMVLAACLPGIGLRLWTRGPGPDAGNLFEPRPLAWVLLWLFTAGVAFLIFWLAKELKHPGTYEENYPKSIYAAACSVPAAVCFMVTGYLQLRGHVALTNPAATAIDTVTGIAGIIAGICLILCALSRLQGKKPFFLLHAAVSLYLAIRLFSHCQSWQNHPQVVNVILPFAASLALMLASWHRGSFNVDLGKRPRCILWCLMSVYLCVLAIFSFEEPVFYGLCALWMMSDLCSLEPLQPQTMEEAPVEAVEEPVDTAEEADAEAPAEE